MIILWGPNGHFWEKHHNRKEGSEGREGSEINKGREEGR
jgi:hypothetical protein